MDNWGYSPILIGFVILDLFSLWFFADSIPLDLSPFHWIYRHEKNHHLGNIFGFFPSTEQTNLREFLFPQKIKMTIMENQPFEDVFASRLSYYN